MLEDWSRAFPGCEPVAHRLRTALPSRWVRFHGLPESKRYPDAEDELQIIMGRWNRVLGELAGSDPRVVLLTTEHSASADVVFDRKAGPWRVVAMHDLEEEFHAPTYWRVFASEWEWRSGVFDPTLRLVATGRSANVMISPPGCRWLFAPYDGGADVILESPAARDRLKAAFAGWLSPWPSGL